MPLLRPSPTPLARDLPADPDLDAREEVAFLKDRGFERQMVFQGRSLESRLNQEAERQRGRTSLAATCERHEIWAHPMGMLARISLFQVGGRERWHLNHAQVFALARVPWDGVQSLTGSSYFRQPDGSVVVGYSGDGLEAMERAWGWSCQAHQAQELLPFEQWEGIWGFKVLPLNLPSFLMDWSDVRVGSPSDIPMVRSADADLRIIRSASVLAKELARHVTAATAGPSLAFWARMFQHALDFPVLTLRDQKRLPVRLAPVVKTVVENWGWADTQRYYIDRFHAGFGRALGASLEQHALTREEAQQVRQWFDWLHSPVSVFTQAVSTARVWTKVKGVDVLDVLCGMPFLHGGIEKAQALLDAIPQDVLEHRLRAEDALGLNLTLRLLALANIHPADRRDEKREEALGVPMGYQLLTRLSERVDPAHFSLQTSQWSAGALLVHVGGYRDSPPLREKRHRHFLNWVEALGLEVTPVLRFPGRDQPIEVSLDTLTLPLLKSATAALYERGHPDFFKHCQPEDLVSMKPLCAWFRARALDHTLPASGVASPRIRF